MDRHEPSFAADSYSARDLYYLSPFFTNTDRSVYASQIFSPELIGALCSRTSRASQDLRWIFLNEFLYPFLYPERKPEDDDNAWREKIRYSGALGELTELLHKHPFRYLFSNTRAREFYFKLLAQFGDDSVAQMAGMHLAYSALSQVAIKHLEDQRIGLAPIEKSTRYVDFRSKVNGKYRYYVDPVWEKLGLEKEYIAASDGLFDTYSRSIPVLISWLAKRFPGEKPAVVEKKAFDCLRGLLPMSTLSQVAFFGNGQSFEYMVNRCLAHGLGEIKWAGRRALEELNSVAPSFFRRIQDESKKAVMAEYQEYLASKGREVRPWVDAIFTNEPVDEAAYLPDVRLIEYDPHGENKVIAGILYSAPNNERSWEELIGAAGMLSQKTKEAILASYLKGRTARWQKVGRAFENTYVRFEIVMNNGAWRDLHRHRMHTQQRQNFSCLHGYDVPQEITESGLENNFRSAVRKMEDVFSKVAVEFPDLAQYAVTLAHRLPFMQYQNLRQCFWEMELRTIPEGHPDYRHVEQAKFRLLEEVFPLITKHMLVNMGEYDFARRGQEERIQNKLKKEERS